MNDRRRPELPAVTRPTLTPLGTVLVPFQDVKGRHMVCELSRTMFRDLVVTVGELFEVLDHQVALGKQLLEIDRHDSVVD